MIRNRLYLLLLLTACSTSGQKHSADTKPSLTEEQIIEKYLAKGAWRVGYFSDEYQAYIDSAIALNPNIAYLYQQKAMPYFKQSKYEAGMSILDKAVELDAKGNIDYRAFIKCIFAKTYKESIKDFMESKKLNGENGYVMDHSYDFYIGVCHLQLNDFKQAAEYLEKSVEHVRKSNGENWIHHLDLLYAGIAHQELNNHEKAIQYFDKALKAYSSFSDAKYYKAISLFRTNHADLAEVALNECESDFKKGFTINEDNAVYEHYPYQIKQFHIDGLRVFKR